ncbi:hypothetical protein, partial [Vibrio breoganii]|uniref:hypothetical protein n=1 Tax=Vibrio breoganii TaxID=553239 RepID=UPI001A7E0861
FWYLDALSNSEIYSYSDNEEKANDYFLIQTDDAFDATRMERLLKMDLLMMRLLKKLKGSLYRTYYLKAATEWH